MKNTFKQIIRIAKGKCTYQIIGTISLLLILISSIIGTWMAPWIINGTLKKLNLKPGNDMRKMWENFPFPLQFSVYVFNITNPAEFTDGKKANLQEIGPFVFDEWKSKKILQENEEEDSVTFEMFNVYKFRSDLSLKLTGNELVTVPHALMMGGLLATKWDLPALLPIAIEGFKQVFEPVGTPLLTAKVIDLLFHGVEVNCDREEIEATVICPMLSTRKGVITLNDTYYVASLFGDKNSTSMGKFKVYRGTNDISKVGEVITFNDKLMSTAFKGECNKINGTDGTIFAPFHEKMDTFYSFTPILCRSIGFFYQNDSVYNGVPTSVYKMEFGDLKDSSCFCRKEDADNCPPKGTLDNFPCVENAMIISKPHFLDADKELLDKVQGLKPDRKRHDNYFQFELNTGSPVSLRNRLQFAIQVEQIEDFELMANITSAVVPLVWIEERLDLPTEVTNAMRYGIYMFKSVMKYVKYSGIVLGILGLTYFGYKWLYQILAKELDQSVTYVVS